jgi:hypothetical protein
VDSGGTPSTGTGPAVDHTLGTTAGKYFFCETSSGSVGNSFILNAPAFDATGVSNPAVTFWYHMYGTTIGTLSLQQSDGIGGWNTLWSLAGQQQTSNAEAWRQASLQVTPDGANMIIVRFHYSHGGTFTGDAAIDDIVIGADSQGKVYETNSPQGSMTINGVVGNACTTPATLDLPLGVANVATLNMSTNQAGGPLGGRYEIGVQAGPLIPGVSLGNGEVVNVDYQAPNFFWVNGGAAGADFFPIPGTQFPGATGGSMLANFLIDTLCPQVFTVQGVLLGNEVAAPFSVYLTQATQITIGPGCLPLSLADDNSIQYNIAALAGVNFYGVNYMSLFVCSNGRVMFNAGDFEFSPSVAEALTDNPFVGPWQDFSPNISGCVSVCEDANGVSVFFGDVPSFGLPNDLGSFSINFLTGGNVTIDHMDNLFPFAEPQFLGMSPGSPGLATDAGPVNYTLGLGLTTNATDMIYNFQPQGGPAAAPGLTTITYTPNAFNNYDWTSN